MLLLRWQPACCLCSWRDECCEGTTAALGPARVRERLDQRPRVAPVATAEAQIPADVLEFLICPRSVTGGGRPIQLS